MTTKEATRRYFYKFVPAMLIYLGGTFGTRWVTHNAEWPPIALYMLITIPILAALSLFWIHWRYLNDVDEFQRLIQIKAMFFAAASVMTVATGWGMLENYLDAPALEILVLNPIFWLSYALAVIVITQRESSYK